MTTEPDIKQFIEYSKIRINNEPVLKLTLPIPPTVNQLYAGKTRRYKSQKYKLWEAEAGYMLNAAQIKPLQGRSYINLLSISKDHKRHDVDNLHKAIGDILQKHNIIENDKLINSNDNQRCDIDKDICLYKLWIVK